jgi:hypothetical protein
MQQLIMKRFILPAVLFAMSSAMIWAGCHRQLAFADQRKVTRQISSHSRWFDEEFAKFVNQQQANSQGSKIVS